MILIGPHHPIEEKIRCAHELFDAWSATLLGDPKISAMLSRYSMAINKTWQTMEEVGVVEICTRCAIEDGGSCCGDGIENKFDVTLLLINLLMGKDLPERPWDETGCWFLGPKGCTIRARHTICVNYICKRLTQALSQESLHRLQEAILAETEAGFLLEEHLKGYLRRCYTQMTST